MIWRRLWATIALMTPILVYAQSYTLTIENARLLVADAMANRIKDSIIQAKDARIRELEQRHIGQILDLQAIIKEKTSQIMAQIAVSETLGQVVTNLEGEVKKERRGKRFWQVVGGVLAVGIVVQSVR